MREAEDRSGRNDETQRKEKIVFRTSNIFRSSTKREDPAENRTLLLIQLPTITSNYHHRQRYYKRLSEPIIFAHPIEKCSSMIQTSNSIT